MAFLIAQFVHLAAAIVWLGGMTFVLFALRPPLGAQLPPPQRLPLLGAILKRFFLMVWLAVIALLVTGGFMLSHAGAQAAPLGWHLMSGIGVLMVLIFGHIHFAAYRRFSAAVASADWPVAGQRAAQIARLVLVNFFLGWLAVALVAFLS